MLKFLKELLLGTSTTRKGGVKRRMTPEERELKYAKILRKAQRKGEWKEFKKIISLGLEKETTVRESFNNLIQFFENANYSRKAAKFEVKLAKEHLSRALSKSKVLQAIIGVELVSGKWVDTKTVRQLKANGKNNKKSSLKQDKEMYENSVQNFRETVAEIVKDFNGDERSSGTMVDIAVKELEAKMVRSKKSYKQKVAMVMKEIQHLLKGNPLKYEEYEIWYHNKYSDYLA